MTNALEGTYRAVASRARSLLLLEPEREVRALGEERQAQVRRYHDAALRRALVADTLADDRSAVSALILYREALGLLTSALVIARGSGAAPEAPERDPWAALAGLAQAGAIPPLPPPVEEARGILTEQEPLTFDEWPTADLLARRATVEAAMKWLFGLVEARTVAEIRASRFARVGVAAVVVVALLAWAVTSVGRPTNLALHRPVTVSARHPQSIAPADNSGAVNGVIESNYGIHTTLGNAWVMVDLQSVCRLSEARIHNRADGWFGEGLPLALELSEDGKTFKEIERRTEVFGAADPWVVQLDGRRARYVRVSSPRYVALTEIEVMGSR
jgi:hypothetical protein